MDWDCGFSTNSPEFLQLGLEDMEALRSEKTVKPTQASSRRRRGPLYGGAGHGGLKRRRSWGSNWRAPCYQTMSAQLLRLWVACCSFSHARVYISVCVCVYLFVFVSVVFDNRNSLLRRLKNKLSTNLFLSSKELFFFSGWHNTTQQ